MMTNDDDNGNNDDDDGAKRIKTTLGIVNQEIQGYNDGEDTIHIEIEVAVKTVTDTIVMANIEVVMKEKESTKDAMFARGEVILLTVLLLTKKLQSVGLHGNVKNYNITERFF